MVDFQNISKRKPIKLAQFKKVEDVLSKTMTLTGVKVKESVFGSGLYISATLIDDEQPVIITTSSQALFMQLAPLVENDDAYGLQFSIEPRGKSFEVIIYE